jgi:cell division protein FtsN
VTLKHGDARRPAPRPRGVQARRSSARGGTLLGIFLGLVLGLGIAATVAFYLGRTSFKPNTPAPVVKEGSKSSKGEIASAPAASEKPRFDFYKILPGAEEPKISKQERPPVVARTEPAKTIEAPAKIGERFWLQAGAFSSESDAENLKARLALSGWEAGIQAATLPDKSIRFRVRLGPYDNTEELSKVKSELGKRGFDVAVIKNP